MTSSSWWRTQSVFAHMVDEIRVARAALVAPPQRLLLRRRSPRHSPKNYWADFLTQYQSETIGGSRAHLLSGADEVLARLVHERVTPSFSPLRLGEIVAHRQFTVSGVLTKDGQFDRAPKRIPEPQKLQTFFDFLESVKLALLFAQRGPELHLNDWGTSFAVAYKEVIASTSVSEALARYLPPDSKGKGDKAGPERVAKLVTALSECLQKGSCSGPLAAKLAGKLTFVCSWVFGRAGQALLKPLYRRQHSSSSAEVELRPALRVSFRLLKQLVPALKPRFLPSISRSVQMRIGRIYADAFITMHGERRCSGRWLEASSALQQLKQSTNGWGAIYFSPSGARSCFRAQVPVEVLQQCCSSTDYIYWLEAVAQLISIAVVARDQFDCLICFVDNTAVEHALNRGTQANLSDKVSRGDYSEASFERAWPDLLRLQHAPSELTTWDYQAVVDSLFD
eukprot:s636_g24.t1